MQSTTTIACRALVMVFCLIAIPLAALFGTSLPDIIKTLGWGATSVSAREKGGEAPLFVANIPEAAGVPDSPAAGSGNEIAQSWPASSAGSVEYPKVPQDMPAVQASFTEPATRYDGSTGAVANGMVDRRPTSRSGGRDVVPVVVGPSDGRFDYIQKRLQGLGATYFRLETFGSDRQLYRFQCEMPLGGAGAVRPFESTSENALDAMESVLSEIDHWTTTK